jgi:hypothetical protein
VSGRGWLSAIRARGLESEERLLDSGARGTVAPGACVAADRAIRGDDAMAGNEDRRWIATHRPTGGTGGAGSAGQRGQFGVGAAAPGFLASDRVPARSLEGRSARERQVGESLQDAAEVPIEARREQPRTRRRTSVRRRQAKELEPADRSSRGVDPEPESPGGSVHMLDAVETPRSRCNRRPRGHRPRSAIAFQRRSITIGR